MRIDIVVYPGIDELDVVGPLEVLRGAAAAGAALDVRLVGIDGASVPGTFGMTFTPDDTFMPGDADVVVVPGGGWAARAEQSAWGEVQRGDWLPLLAAAADRGALMASVCTGAMLLAHAGVIAERPATTHEVAKRDLAALGATVLDERVVDAGNLVTGAGVTSGIDVGLHLVARLVGAETAEVTARRMEHSWTRATVVDDGHPAG